jgi:hypothetical protein
VQPPKQTGVGARGASDDREGNNQARPFHGHGLLAIPG